MELLLYCTKGKPRLFSHLDCIWKINNGMIVAACDCDLVEKIDVPYPAYFYEVKDRLSHITEKSCLSLLELHHYLRTDTGYGLHLENVGVFVYPKKLSDYGLKRAPQNMCYCFDENGNKCILISIHPEPLRDIVNGKKTIEVRRKILKELKELMK